MFRKLFVALMVLSLTASVQAGEWFGFELYPRGDLFVYAKKNLAHGTKIDIWSIPGGEVGTAIGPRFDWHGVEFGFGASLGFATEQIKAKCYNFDCRFNFDLGQAHYSTYNLYQDGQNGHSDFTLLRHTMTFAGTGWGVIGHNIQIGSQEFQAFWGPQYAFGRISFVPTNTVAVAADLLHSDSYWAVWIVEF